MCVCVCVFTYVCVCVCGCELHLQLVKLAAPCQVKLRIGGGKGNITKENCVLSLAFFIQNKLIPLLLLLLLLLWFCRISCSCYKIHFRCKKHFRLNELLFFTQISTQYSCVCEHTLHAIIIMVYA